MELEYITDENGERIAVIIPIDEWYSISGKNEDFGDQEEESDQQEDARKAR